MHFATKFALVCTIFLLVRAPIGGPEVDLFTFKTRSRPSRDGVGHSVSSCLSGDSEHSSLPQFDSPSPSAKSVSDPRCARSALSSVGGERTAASSHCRARFASVCAESVAPTRALVVAACIATSEYAFSSSAQPITNLREKTRCGAWPSRPRYELLPSPGDELSDNRARTGSRTRQYLDFGKLQQ